MMALHDGVSHENRVVSGLALPMPLVRFQWCDSMIWSFAGWWMVVIVTIYLAAAVAVACPFVWTLVEWIWIYFVHLHRIARHSPSFWMSWRLGQLLSLWLIVPAALRYDFHRRRRHC